MADYIEYRTNGSAVAFVGQRAVNVFACAVVASALRLYAKTGMKANRSYTPTNMLRFTKEQTGITFRRGQYLEAAEALSTLVQSEKAKLRA